MSSVRPLLTPALIALLSACQPYEAPSAEDESESALTAAKFHLSAQISILSPPLVAVGQPFCPNGAEPYSLSVKVCYEPVEATCTTWYCPDPNGGPPTRASIVGGGPNPVCSASSLQPKPCSNTISWPERTLPSRAELVERLPHIFGKELLKAPLLK